VDVAPPQVYGFKIMHEIPKRESACPVDRAAQEHGYPGVFVSASCRVHVRADNPLKRLPDQFHHAIRRGRHKKVLDRGLMRLTRIQLFYAVAMHPRIIGHRFL
jgi:hypothetical protein